MSDKKISSQITDEESINHYSVISYKLSEEEIIKNGSGVTCISSYCTCSVKNNNCICFQNMTKIIQK